MKFTDCWLYRAVSATGGELFSLVAKADDIQAVFRREHKDYDGAVPWHVGLRIPADAQRRYFERGKRPSAEEVAACEAIYAAYPRKVGKPAALKAIAAALRTAPTDADGLLKLTKMYAAAVATWQEHDKQFVPHPSTWFRQERFKDDPATWERKDTRNGRRGIVPDHSKGF